MSIQKTTIALAVLGLTLGASAVAHAAVQQQTYGVDPNTGRTVVQTTTTETQYAEPVVFYSDETPGPAVTAPVQNGRGFARSSSDDNGAAPLPNNRNQNFGRGS